MNTGNVKKAAHRATAAAARAKRRDARTGPVPAVPTACRLAVRSRWRKRLLVAGVGALGWSALACGGGPGAETAPPGLASAPADGSTSPSLAGGAPGFGQGPYTGPCYARPDAGAAIGWLPADLPLPEGTYPITQLQDDGRFRRAVLAVPMTYGDFVQFVLARWPDEGWILGRGESEVGEAEDGFVRGDTYGAFRARRVYCDDGWSEILLALSADPPTTTVRSTG